MSTPEDTPVEQTSSEAENSTYEAASDLPETNPPMGPQVIQTRGLPAEAAPSGKTSSRSSAKDTSS